MLRSSLTAMVLSAGMALAGSGQAAENELGWTLDSALKQIDRQAQDFTTLLAQVDSITRDTSGQQVRSLQGRLYMNSGGDIRINVAKPEEGVLLVTDDEVQHYDPVKALVERYPTSKYKDRMEPYARLGFTATGKDLKDDYLVTLLGEDTVGSQRALMLELTPKRDDERQVVGKVTLWIDQSSWMPLRQVIEHVSTHEQLTIDYSGMARNLNLNSDLFRSNWPKGTQQIRR